MYCRAGQQTEEEMYNNEEGGPAFNEFLDVIGCVAAIMNPEPYFPLVRRIERFISKTLLPACADLVGS